MAKKFPELLKDINPQYINPSETKANSKIEISQKHISLKLEDMKNKVFLKLSEGIN